MSIGPNPYAPGTPGVTGGPTVEEVKKKATNALIAAIVGFFCCPFVHIYTIMTANDAIGTIERTGVGQEHKSMANIARIIAYVHLALIALGIIAQIILFVIGAGAAAVNN